MGNSLVRVEGEQIKKHTFDNEKSIVVTKVFLTFVIPSGK